MEPALAAIGVVLLIALGALATLAGAAVDRIGRAKAHHLAQEKRPGAERLLAIVEDPPLYMNAVMLLAVLAQVGASVLVTMLMVDELDGGAGGWIVAAVLVVVIFVFAQLVPRTVALQHPEGAALSLARPVFLIGRGLRPISKLLIALSNGVMAVLPGRGLPEGPFITEEEIRHLVDVAEEGEEIEEEERELIHSVFEFGDTVVREVMVPRTDMVVIPSDASIDQALETIIEAGYSRVPIYEGDTDNIVCVLYAKDLLKRSIENSGGSKAAALGRAPLFVPEQKKVAELLREMQESRIHMAIVVDEYGGTAGLVTIEDLVEEIVGEIVDEYDQEEPLVEPIDEETIRVDAKMPIDEVNELLEAELPHEEWDTVGGLVFGLTGRVPMPGEKVRFDGLEFLTERVSGRRILKVVIRKVADEREAEAEAEAER
jgi:CBS domain containing-hemolysin-like protein